MTIGTSDVFISYSTQDSSLARQLHQAIQNVGAKTFLAELSIPPGTDWQDEIFKELRSSKFVFFLASKAACNSYAVQQEIGASIIQQKVVFPLLIDISASELPGFIGTQQAIDLRTDVEKLQSTIRGIGKKLSDDRFLAGAILAAVLIAVIAAR